jgi:hypothetical protein
VYCNKKCLPCIISSVNFNFQRRAQVKFAMTYRSVHRVSQQFAGSIVVRPTDWKWIDIALLNHWTLLVWRYQCISLTWFATTVSYMPCVLRWNFSCWLAVTDGLESVRSQIQHNEQIIQYAATALIIILLILINLGQAGLSLSFARSFGMYFRELTMALSNVFLLALNVWNWLGSKTYYYFDLRRYVWWALQQHWKQQLLEILILKQFWLQY